MADISPKDPLFPILHSSSHSSHSEDDPPIPQSIHDKLRYAFKKFQRYHDRGLIQFWEPVNINGRRLLTTSDQPFLVLEDDDEEDFEKYRLCCEKYKYNIDVLQVEVEEEEPTNTILSTGAPATAFLNQLPEFPKSPAHMSVEEMSPLESSALECGLKCSFMIPVFYPSQSGCVGVVEYSMKYFSMRLIDALEDVGFKMFDAKELLPYKSICGLQHAKDEIDDALVIISEVFPLESTQIWMAYEDEYLSSSLQDTLSKRMLWLKLTDSYVDDKNFFDRFPMKKDQVFAGKTLQNYEPLFIRDILKLINNEPQRLHFSLSSSCCFMICLRSTKTGELDYVFEFLWSETRHNDYIFELLLVSLKRHLPSFKFVFGAELGDELRIIDAQASTESETIYIKISHPNQLPDVSVTTKRGRRPDDEECLAPLKAKCKTAKKEISLEQIKSQFGKTQKEAAKNLNMSLSTLKRYCKVLGISEWHGKDYSKENVNYLYKNTRSNSNEKEDNGRAIQDPSANIRETSLGENILTIKVEYPDHDSFKFHLPISSATFESIEKEINKRFKLNPSDYKVMYLDEDGDWISLSSDEDMRISQGSHQRPAPKGGHLKVIELLLLRNKKRREQESKINGKPPLVLKVV